MEALQALPSVSRLSPNVIRILGQNPSKYTLQGTNTYLVGQHNPYILVDTGEGREDYIPILQEVLNDPSNRIQSEEADISDIIITHKHGDHINGLPSVLSLLERLWKSSRSETNISFPPPRIHKFPHSAPVPNVEKVINTLSKGSFTESLAGAALHDLKEGQTFELSTNVEATKGDHILEVVHTPGHTPDSICLHLPADRALFTADTIIGHGTAVFEDLATYMNALQKIISFNKTDDSDELKFIKFYPGHGPEVSHDRAETYLHHRLERENQILDVLRNVPSEDNHWTTWTLVSNIYASYPEHLWEPAAFSVDQHLRKLAAEGRIKLVGGEDRHTAWKLL